MRQGLFVLLLILLHISVSGQSTDDKRFCAMAKFNFSIADGDIANTASEVSPIKYGFGGGFFLSKPIYKGLTIGFALQQEDFKLDRNRAKAFYEAKYADEHFYNDISDTRMLSVFSMVLDVSYRLSLKTVEIEPYIRGGLAAAQNMSHVFVERKMKNSNYNEDLIIESENSTNFLYLGAGSRISYPIFKWLYAVGSVGYSYGKFNIGIQETKKDFIEVKTERNYQVSQVVSVTQMEFGFQFRAGRSPKNDSKTDETKH